MIFAFLFIALAASVSTYAATRWALVSARRRIADAERAARLAEDELQLLLDQLRPRQLTGTRGALDLTGWGARGLVYGGPGGAQALAAALIGTALAAWSRRALTGQACPLGGPRCQQCPAWPACRERATW